MKKNLILRPIQKWWHFNKWPILIGLPFDLLITMKAKQSHDACLLKIGGIFFHHNLKCLIKDLNWGLRNVVRIVHLIYLSPDTHLFKRSDDLNLFLRTFKECVNQNFGKNYGWWMWNSKVETKCPIRYMLYRQSVKRHWRVNRNH